MNEIQRQKAKGEQILELLRERGLKGATNKELSKIALRYGGYIGALYPKGYDIRKKSLGDGVFRYVLIREPVNKREAKNAKDLLIKAVKQQGTITAEELETLFENLNIGVRFKANTHKVVNE